MSFWSQTLCWKHSEMPRLLETTTPADLLVLFVAFHWRTLTVFLFQGKYVEIQFGRGGQPDGGKISNFLLEKVSSLPVYFIWEGEVIFGFCSHGWSVRMHWNEISTFSISSALGPLLRTKVSLCE